MNGDPASAWVESDQFPSLSTMEPSDFDFVGLPDGLDEFDFANLHFDQAFGTSPGAQGLSNLVSQTEENVMDGTNEGNERRPSQQEGNGNGTLHLGQEFMDFHIEPQYGNGGPQLGNKFGVTQEHGYLPQRMAPPTPTSMELTAADAVIYINSLDPATRSIVEQQFMRKNDVAQFTPLLSPVVPSNDSRNYAPSDYSSGGPLFSPLASPALMGLGDHSRIYGRRSQAASTSSPGADAREDVDMFDNTTSHPIPAPPSRPKRAVRAPKATAAASRSAAPTPRLRQSPIVKPQRRKGASTTLPPREVQALLGQSAHPRAPLSPASVPSFSFPGSRSGSDGDSISPEPLTEVMGPPPKPASAAPSPNIMAKSGHRPLNQSHLAPATPASLLRSHQVAMPPTSHYQSPTLSPNSAAQTVRQNPEPFVLDDLILPEAAAEPSRTQPGSGSISTSRPANGPVSASNTPRLSSAKRPELDQLHIPANTPGKSSPLLTASPLATPSSATPRLSAASTTGQTPGNGGKANGRKRGSVSGGTMASPALRPKISPSIKPLLPEGGPITPEAHAILLASKSNYHHILEGTALAGPYPETLSRGLTSKRTSHKLAEQGRRNRINSALVEMQSLLPQSPILNASRRGSVSGLASGNASPEFLAADAGARAGGTAGKDVDEGAEKGGKGGAQQLAGNSKAATVESAIAYIRLLQSEADERRRVLEEKDRELEELRRRVGALGGD
ncbi:hypothetical protein P152DRAFT_455081 [Eremomyces bilateralis CBS 781.70]|uniref:BHLH domain-containing protein n=1 Tax=Eremomyces bilateralis CBS 781.70 TaxID=1392243 RepID=A0A6G1GC02_9PEZI|nr:uncharacterized protein P152DRAFT_455081 [Eremomyces bilateralis CBS 781.70]KAF1815369.1 hypothetical protein P152DRAFT_455081 [Eremomyces bilateralis CBS 781.70]